MVGLWVLLVGAAHAVPLIDRDLEEAGFSHVRAELGGFIQPRFRWTPDDPDANLNGQIGFNVQRARLSQSVELTGAPIGASSHWKFSVREGLSIELSPEPVLQDAFINVGIGTEFQITAGQFKAPVHRAILAGDQNNLFPDRNQITTWVPEREIGVMLHGWWGERVIEWQVAAFDGEGKNRVGNVNKKLMYAGRVAFSPLGSPGTNFEILKDWRPDGQERIRPTFTVGYSFFQNTTGSVGTQQASLGHNVEFFFHYRPLTVMSEVFYRTSDFEAVEVADDHQLGGYVQAGMFLAGVPWAKDHIAVMGRFEQGDPFIPNGADVPPTGPTDPNQGSRRESVGLGIYANEPLFRFVQDLRLVVSYTFRQELEGFDLKNDELNVSSTLSF